MKWLFWWMLCLSVLRAAVINIVKWSSCYCHINTYPSVTVMWHLTILLIIMTYDSFVYFFFLFRGDEDERFKTWNEWLPKIIEQRGLSVFDYLPMFPHHCSLFFIIIIIMLNLFFTRMKTWSGWRRTFLQLLLTCKQSLIIDLFFRNSKTNKS